MNQAVETPDGYEPPSSSPPVTSAERGEDGAAIVNLAAWLGCTILIAKRVAGEPVGFALYAHTGSVYDLFDAAKAVELLDHPEVVASRQRRANRMTTKKRKQALWEVVKQYDLSRPELVAIHVESYKSVRAATIPVGSMAVLMGPNGAGKTNLLEAIALTSRSRYIFDGDPTSDARILRSGIESRGRYDTPSERVYFIFDVGEQAVDGIPEAVEYALSRSPLSDSKNAHQILERLLTKPLIAVCAADQSTALFSPPETSTEELSQDAIPNSAAIKDDLIVTIVDMIGDRRTDWVKILEVSTRTDLSIPTVRVLDTDPATIQSDLRSAVELLTEESRSGGKEAPPTMDDSIEGIDLSHTMWIRWVNLAASTKDIGSVAPESLTTDMMLPASGTATHIVYGTGDVFPSNIIDSASLADRQDTKRLMARIKKDGSDAGWGVLVRDMGEDPRFDYGPWGTADATPLFGSLIRMYIIGVGGQDESFDLDQVDPWLQLSEDGASIREEILEALNRIEYEANLLAPPFVQDLGRITLQLAPAAEWERDERVKVQILGASPQRELALNEIGRGAQKWVAASIRETTRRLTRSQTENSARTEILIIDEPELALHPAAQEQVAAWCTRAARHGQRIVVATHSPAFLDLSPSIASISVVRNIDGYTTVNPLNVEAIAGLDSLGEALGLGRSTLMFAVRGFLAVEGPSDVEVLKALMGPELREHRIIPVPLHGFPGVSGLVQLHLLEAIGRPVAVMLDDVQRSVVDGHTEAETNEEMIMMKVLAARDQGLPMTAISFDAPDIMCALPEAAVRRVRGEFTSWDDLIESHDPAEGNFKSHVMDTLNWKRENDRGFISEVLKNIAPADDLPPAFKRSRAEILAWAEDRSAEREFDLPSASI